MLASLLLPILAIQAPAPIETIAPPYRYCIEQTEVFTVPEWSWAIAFEDRPTCTIQAMDGPSPGWHLTEVLSETGQPAMRCRDMGGTFELVGNPLGFHLLLCWDVDY